MKNDTCVVCGKPCVKYWCRTCWGVSRGGHKQNPESVKKRIMKAASTRKSKTTNAQRISKKKIKKACSFMVRKVL